MATKPLMVGASASASISHRLNATYRSAMVASKCGQGPGPFRRVRLRGQRRFVLQPEQVGREEVHHHAVGESAPAERGSRFPERAGVLAEVDPVALAVLPDLVARLPPLPLLARGVQVDMRIDPEWLAHRSILGVPPAYHNRPARAPL